MENEKNCLNCKHYKKLYTIYKVKLKEFGGWCSQDNIFKKNLIRQISPRTDCKYWEDREELLCDRREKIENELRKMKRTLSDIALILKTEI